MSNTFKIIGGYTVRTKNRHIFDSVEEMLHTVKKTVCIFKI